MRINKLPDHSLELCVNVTERSLLYEALRHYSARSEERRVLEVIPAICRLMNEIDPEGCPDDQLLVLKLPLPERSLLFNAIRFYVSNAPRVQIAAHVSMLHTLMTEINPGNVREEGEE